jgi:hypothetical protein
LSFANSRDGGVIVIGKDEESPGSFTPTGLTGNQADSFETTKVATWVNNKGAPPVNLVCYRVQHDGNEFIVLTVAEFDDVPVICTKQYELPGKPAKVVLRKGAIYVRTANAESAPLSSIEDLRTLIGIATTKRADEMLSMFQSMMKGQPLLEAKPDEEHFEVERGGVEAALDSELGGTSELGAWTLTCHPIRYDVARWDEASDLKAIVERSAVRLRRAFPPVNYDMHVREWGICDQSFEDAFGMTRSGLFVAMRLFRENTTVFRNPWQPNTDIPAGEWLDFKLNLGIVIEFFVFLSRFAENFDVGEETVVELVAGPLTGRRLVSMDSSIELDPTDPCRAGRFRYKKMLKVETLRASWEEQCVKALRGFFEFFNGDRISEKTFADWVERFKERKFP